MAGRLISALGLRAALVLAALGLLLAGAVAANEKPDAKKDRVRTRANKPVVIRVLDNDKDADGDPLKLLPTLNKQASTGTCTANADSTLTYVPDKDFTGDDGCKYAVSDGQEFAVGKVEIEVEKNKRPEARDDIASTEAGQQVEIPVLVNDRDRNHPIDILKVVEVRASDPSRGQAQVRGDSLVVYAPAAGFGGQDHLLTYWVSDGDLQDSAAVTVSVGANQPPTAVDDSAATTSGTAVEVAVLDNDEDPDDDALEVVEVILSDPSRSQAQIRGDSLIVYTPHQDASGLDSLAYVVSDGKDGLDTASVRITVLKLPPVNQPPQALDDVVDTEPGKAVRIEALDNDSDPDGDALRINSVTAGDLTNGTATIAADSLSVQYTPDSGFKGGRERFKYVVSDGRGGTAAAMITVNVVAAAKAPATPTPTNQPPVAQDDQDDVMAGQEKRIAVLVNDRDPDRDKLKIVSATSPQHGSVRVAKDRQSVVYEAAPNFEGEDRFSYAVSDGQQQAEGKVVVQVKAAPAAAAAPTPKPMPQKTAATKPKEEPAPGISLWTYAGGGVFALALLVVVIVYLTRRKAPSPEPEPQEEPASDAIEVKLSNYSLLLGNAQDIGKRPYQEDAFGFSNWEDDDFLRHSGLLAVVADGMGGLEQGTASSNAALRTFIGEYEGKTPDESIPETLLRALHAANQAVLGVARQAGVEGNAGTTLIAVVVHEAALYWISVGDSRIALARDGQFAQLAEDHIYARHLAREVAQGTISREEAESHPEREALTSYVGMQDLEEIERNAKAFPLQPGDYVLLCSDGVYKNMTDEEIANLLRDDPQTAGENLVQAVLAKQDRHQDNLTAVTLMYRR